MTAIGPAQLLVLGSDKPDFYCEAIERLRERRRARDADDFVGPLHLVAIGEARRRSQELHAVEKTPVTAGA